MKEATAIKIMQFIATKNQKYEIKKSYKKYLPLDRMNINSKINEKGLQGIWKKFETAYDGEVFEIGNYVDGVKEGKFVKEFDDGVSNVILCTTTYVNGVKDGPFKDFDFDGVLKVEGNFKAGELDGMCKFYKNGKPHYKQMFKDGQAVSNPKSF